MAVKREHNKQTQGLRGTFNRHFGRDEEGASFIRNFTREAGENLTCGIPSRPSEKGTWMGRSIRFSAGLFMTASFSAMLGTGVWEVAHIFHDGEIAADADLSYALTGNADGDYYTAFRTGSDTAFMITKDAENGDYAVFEGKKLWGNDWQFNLIDDEAEAAYAALSISNDLQEAALFPDIDRNVTPISFEAMSAPYADNGVTYRAGDEGETPSELTSATYTVAADSFEQAYEAIAAGQVVTAYDDVQDMENPLVNPADDLEKELRAMFIAMGAMGALGVGLAAGTASSRSRRRFDNAYKKQGPS